MKLEAYSQITKALKESEAGRSLQDTYRWSTFRNQESDGQWRRLLGATANDFSHGLLIYGLSRLFLRYEGARFTQEEREILLYGTLCHDWGEAILNGHGVGDVSIQVKTALDEEKESVIAHEAIASLSLPLETKQKLKTGYEHVVEGRDQKLHQAFKALERTEYLMTAMKLYKNCQQQKAKGEMTASLEQAFVGRVLVFDLSKILNVYVSEYPHSIGIFIHGTADLLDEMYQYALPWLQETKTWLDKPVDHGQLAQSLLVKWGKFKETFKPDPQPSGK